MDPVNARRIPRPFPPLHPMDLMRRAGLRPRKSLGQNFLLDEGALDRVAEAAGILDGDTVLEIGAGLGSLTRHLAERASRVVAVEIDRALIPILHEVTSAWPNVHVVEGDILELDLRPWLGSVAPGRFLVCANIPYYITSAILRRLLESSPRPARLVLTVQREVADRICARPGEMSLLAVSVQFYGQAAVVDSIPAGAFYPAPKVDSAVVRVEVRPDLPEAGFTERFFRGARMGFSQKRKTLRNTLAAGLQIPGAAAETLLQSAGIDPKRRAETLSVEEWSALASRLPSPASLRA